MSSYRSYYDIELIENDGIEELKDANKLYFSRDAETDNNLEFAMPRKFGSIFSIPVKDILNVADITRTSGAFGINDSFVMQIRFLHRSITGPEKSHTISFNVADKAGSVLDQHLQYLRDVETNPQIQRQFKSDLHPELCIECFVNSFTTTVKSKKLCDECFLKIYGNVVLHTPSAEYHGGHKAYLAGGMFGKHESGQMLLTESHLFFRKDDEDPSKRIEIIIPLSSIIIEGWNVLSEARRKEISGLGGSVDNIGLGSIFIHESGKAHRLMVPYVDENGIPQQPIFGVSSFRGKAIRQWASELYNSVVKVKSISQQGAVSNRSFTAIAQQPSMTGDKSNENTDSEAHLSKEKKDSFIKPRSPITIFSQQFNEVNKNTDEEITPDRTNENTIAKNDEFLNILKMRLVKGEISKEEYIELRKMIES
jgi:hypothetical protein